MIKAFAILAFAGLANAGAITYGAAPVAAYGAHPAVHYASSPYAQTYAAHPGVYGSQYAQAVAQPLAYAQPIAKAVAPVAYAQPIAKAVAYAQPIAKAVVASPEPYDPHPQYNYGYSVSDALTGDSKTAHETRDGDVVSGQYSLVEPDGAIRTVTYTSDPVNGFNAVVDRQAPGVVKAVAAPVVAKAVAPVAYAQPIAKAVHPAYLG